MKKTILFAFAALTLSNLAMADAGSLTSTPTYSVTATKICLTGSGDEQGFACVTSTILAPISSTTLGALLALKEEVINVEQDAHNSLAGEPMSLALSELVEKVRAENEELAATSDLEIITILLETI